MAFKGADMWVIQVVTRTGIPTETEDMRMCSANMARSIILLSPAGLPAYEADAFVRRNFLYLEPEQNFVERVLIVATCRAPVLKLALCRFKCCATRGLVWFPVQLEFVVSAAV